MSEQIKLIIREVNKLCNKDYNMISFDSLDAPSLMQVVSDVLFNLTDQDQILVTKLNMEEVALKIMMTLNKIKYLPPGDYSYIDFREGVRTAQTKIMYGILEWVLTNKDKVGKRMYLSEYVEKIVAPDDAFCYPDFVDLYNDYENKIKDFWQLYNTNNTVRKSSLESSDLQEDIKRMENDISNLTLRLNTQKDKLNHVPNKEGLLVAGKGYLRARHQEMGLTKQSDEQQAILKQLDFELRGVKQERAFIKSKWSPDMNLLKQVGEELHINRIFFDTQLPEEFHEAEKSVDIYEKAIETSLSPEHYKKSISTLKAEVQELMAEKLTRYSNNEDQLGPFRNQATIISNKKQDISNTVRELRDKIKVVDDTTKEKETTLFNLVGGEVLHGDQLKQFIAKLREKNIEYKKLRTELQSYVSEYSITSRTVDILKSIDPTVEQAIKKEFIKELPNEQSNTRSEAKQKAKDIFQEVETLLSTTAQIKEELNKIKKDADEVADNYEEVKEKFERATSVTRTTVEHIKKIVNEENEKIDQLERTWKKISQDLEKNEYVFNRLLDDLVSETERRVTYYQSLYEKSGTLENSLEQCNKKMIEIEKYKETQCDVQKFFKNIENLLETKTKEEE